MSTYGDWVAAGRPKTGSLSDAGYVPESARGSQGQRAGLFTRGIAAVIDVAVTLLVMVAAWLGVALFLWALPPVGPVDMPSAWWFVGLGILLLWLSWTTAYATTGRSFGALVMGIRVVNRRGHSMSWPMAGVRALANMAFPIGLLWVIPSAQNRSVQDLVLRSNVIYAWAARLRITVPL